MLTPPETCKCGQTWRWSSNDPSPITKDGCPACSKAAAEVDARTLHRRTLEAVDATAFNQKAMS